MCVYIYIYASDFIYIYIYICTHAWYHIFTHHLAPETTVKNSFTHFAGLPSGRPHRKPHGKPAGFPHCTVFGKDLIGTMVYFQGKKQIISLEIRASGTWSFTRCKWSQGLIRCITNQSESMSMYPLVNVYITIIIHHFECVNHLCLWPFSLAKCSIHLQHRSRHETVAPWRTSGWFSRDIPGPGSAESVSMVIQGINK